MTITRQAYEKHDFIRTSVDLLCAGASWQGGKFVARRGDAYCKIIPTIETVFLEKLAKTLLLDGQAFIEVASAEGKVFIKQIESPNPTMGGTVKTIVRVEDSFSSEAVPILERVGSNIEIYEKTFELLLVNPRASEFLRHILSVIHSALAIPSYMLDEARFSEYPEEALMMGASKYRDEVDCLRHTLEYGLNEVAKILDIDDVSWEWNVTWSPDGLCKYGHVYQVFKSKCITLTRIKNSEIGAMKSELEAGLIPKSAFAECVQSYGNE